MGLPSQAVADRRESAVEPVRDSAADVRAKPPAADWGPVTRVLFRFAFVYLVVYNLDFLRTPWAVEDVRLLLRE